MHKYIYFGANLHIDVLDILDSKDKTIIYVDSLPKNEYGYEFQKSFYRPKFYNDLLVKFKLKNYDLIKTDILKPLVKMEYYGLFNYFLPKYFNPTCLTFYNKNLNKEVKYYISSGIPRYLTEELINDMYDCHNVIISGHHPPGFILDYLSTPVVAYCYNQTVFNSDEYDEDTIINRFEGDKSNYLLLYLVDYKINKVIKYFNNLKNLNYENSKLLNSHY